MKYEDYIKKYQHQIEEAKKTIQTPSFKDVQEFINSEEYKRNLKIIKKRNELAHKNILLEIDLMQNKLFEIADTIKNSKKVAKC